MTIRRKFESWLSRLPWYRREARDADLARELRDHLELEADEHRAAGLSPKEATNAAHRALGNTLKIEEDVRAAWGFRWLETLAQDLRYGLRMLRKSPGFTAVAVLTLALGIGSNTAIYSLINGILFAPLPVRDANHLVLLQWSAHKGPNGDLSWDGECQDRVEGASASGCSFSMPFLEKVQSRTNAFSGVAAFAGSGDLILSGNTPPSSVYGEYVNGDFFRTLGVRAVAGRTVLPSDDQPGAPLVTVLSYAYWQSEFGGSRSAIGKIIYLNGKPFTIVGVIEPKFLGAAPGAGRSIWIPFSVQSQITPGFTLEQVGRNTWWISILGRLKPAVPSAKAQAALDVIFHNESMNGTDPSFHAIDDPHIRLISAQQGLTGSRGRYSEELYILMLAVGIILLIACANVAGLTLARSAARRREMAVRQALGASRARIARQLLTESALLALAGGALGTFFAFGSIKTIAVGLTGSTSTQLDFPISLDGRVLAFTAAAAILTGILFGLAPALRSTRVNLTPALKESAGGSAETSRVHVRWFTLGNSLVVVQVALAVVVLAGSGLLVRTLQDLKDINLGFDAHNILLFNVDAAHAGYKPSDSDNLYSELSDRLRKIPGVTSVSYSRWALLSGSSSGQGFYVHGLPNWKESEMATFYVGPNFFRTMRMHILAGRDFAPSDIQIVAQAAARYWSWRLAQQQRAPSSSASTLSEPTIPAIVNETFVREFFPHVNPIGQSFGKDVGSTGGGWRIVGVVNDAKYSNLRSAIAPTAYMPSSGGRVTFELRSAAVPTVIIPAVREAVNSLDSNLPITDVMSQSEQINDLLLRERTIAAASGFFAVLALALACIGLYGLLAYEIARRTREIGIRMALGAQQADVLRMVVGQGIALAIVGAFAGIAAALSITRFLSSLLFGVKPDDPATFFAVAVLLVLVALAACCIPARRAMKVDPMIALRYE